MITFVFLAISFLIAHQIFDTLLKNDLEIIKKYPVGTMFWFRTTSKSAMPAIVIKHSSDGIYFNCDGKTYLCSCSWLKVCEDNKFCWK